MARSMLSLGHVALLRLGEREPQARVHRRVPAAELGGDGDLLDRLGEDLPLPRVGGGLLVLDVRPSGMSGHGAGSSESREAYNFTRHEEPAMTEPLAIAKAGSEELCLLPGLANRHGLIAGATGTGKTVTLQVLAREASRASAFRSSWPTSRAISPASRAPGSLSPKMKERLAALKLDEPKCGRLPGRLLGRLRRAGPPGAGDDLRHGAAAPRAAAEPQRHAGGRAHARLQDRRRQRPRCSST